MQEPSWPTNYRRGDKIRNDHTHSLWPMARQPTIMTDGSARNYKTYDLALTTTKK